MSRHAHALSALAASCALTAPALAVFTGIDLREDKGQIPPVELAQIDPMGLGVRVINLYATFDGAGTYSDGAESDTNAALVAFSGVDNVFPTPDPFRINKAHGKHDAAQFYQDAFGGNVAPQESIVSIFPTVAWDTYVDIAFKTVPTGIDDSTGLDQVFDWVDQDLDGQHDGVIGGWFTSSPLNEQHLATFNAQSNQYEVFLAQMTIVGLDGGAEIGALTIPVAGEGTYNWAGDIFTGHLSVFTQRQGGGALRHVFNFAKPVPAPASILLALPGGLALARRSRCRA